jgi:hypothetical protein
MSGPYLDTPGFSQSELALSHGGFSSARQQLGGGGMEGPKHPNSVSHWHQDMLVKDKYQFNSPQEANLAIKGAARTFGPCVAESQNEISVGIMTLCMMLKG